MYASICWLGTEEVGLATGWVATGWLGSGVVVTTTTIADPASRNFRSSTNKTARSPTTARLPAIIQGYRRGLRSRKTGSCPLQRSSQSGSRIKASQHQGFLSAYASRSRAGAGRLFLPYQRSAYLPL